MVRAWLVFGYSVGACSTLASLPESCTCIVGFVPFTFLCNRGHLFGCSFVRMAIFSSMTKNPEACLDKIFIVLTVYFSSSSVLKDPKKSDDQATEFSLCNVYSGCSCLMLQVSLHGDGYVLIISVSRFCLPMMVRTFLNEATESQTSKFILFRKVFCLLDL